VKRAAALALLALTLAGCGSTAGGGEGSAKLWITRDRGAQVLLVQTVPAGQTAMQALRREAKVDTRYGGRFVQAINGIKGSLTKRRDWFYFVNGYEADRSAADYRLRAGDVEWWDFRSWRQRMEEPIVVGAFPEPFLRGYNGKRRRAVVRYGGSSLARGARALGRLIRAKSVAPLPTPAPKDSNVLQVVEGLLPRLDATLREQGAGAGSAVFFTYVGNPMRLARHPELVRYRYAWSG
jgi:uncharacterized protein DUF4430